MPIAQQDLAPILKSPPHAYVHNRGITAIAETSEQDTQAYLNKSQHRKVVWNYAKSTLLTYQKETTQPRLLIRAISAPWVLSTAGKLLRYLRGSYLLPDRNPSFWCFVPPIFAFFYLPVLSIYSRSANIRPVHSNWVLSLLAITRHAPLLLIGCKCVLGHGPTLRSKAFFKNCLVHL